MYGTAKTVTYERIPKPSAISFTTKPELDSERFFLNSVPSSSANQIAARELTPVDTVLKTF